VASLVEISPGLENGIIKMDKKAHVEAVLKCCDMPVGNTNGCYTQLEPKFDSPRQTSPKCKSKI
jgi:hypothetical protein